MLRESLLTHFLRVEGVVPELLLHEGVRLHLVLRLLSHEIGLLVAGRNKITGLIQAMQSTTVGRRAEAEGGPRERNFSMFFFF